MKILYFCRVTTNYNVVKQFSRKRIDSFLVNLLHDAFLTQQLLSLSQVFVVSVLLGGDQARWVCKTIEPILTRRATLSREGWLLFILSLSINRGLSVVSILGLTVVKQNVNLLIVRPIC